MTKFTLLFNTDNTSSNKGFMSISVDFDNYLSQSMDDVGLKTIHRFFITFSRFEFALKASIVFAHQAGNYVEPNWDVFTNTIQANFHSAKNQELQDAVDYILQHPPKKQSLANGVIIWVDRVFVDNISDVKKLDIHIRDIRNNLFHGSKFNGSFQPDVSRDFTLLRSSLVILDEWLNLEPNVAHLFSQPIS
jgi:hypothetical protein